MDTLSLNIDEIALIQLALAALVIKKYEEIGAEIQPENISSIREIIKDCNLLKRKIADYLLPSSIQSDLAMSTAALLHSINNKINKNESPDT